METLLADEQESSQFVEMTKFLDAGEELLLW